MGLIFVKLCDDTPNLGQIWKNRAEYLLAMITEMNPRKDERLALPALGEYYDDLLVIDSWINNRSKVVQGQSLLCAKIQEREARIKERVEYLANKRGISINEMWLSILSGKAQRMSPSEVGEMLEESKDDED